MGEVRRGGSGNVFLSARIIIVYTYRMNESLIGDAKSNCAGDTMGNLTEGWHRFMIRRQVIWEGGHSFLLT